MTLYHVADAEGVPNIQEGLDRRPPLNRWAQYAEGFYLFGDLRDARQWQENRILFWRRHHVVLRFEIPDAEWQPLHVEFVSDENDWNLPDEWLTDYDVLEGRWGYTPDTHVMAGAWQYKFNTHCLVLLNGWLKGSEPDE